MTPPGSIRCSNCLPFPYLPPPCSLGMLPPSDARAIRSRIIECFERASYPDLPSAAQARLLSFLVVGGGPTSVEFASELYDFLRKDVHILYPDLEHMVKKARWMGGRVREGEREGGAFVSAEAHDTLSPSRSTPTCLPDDLGSGLHHNPRFFAFFTGFSPSASLNCLCFILSIGERPPPFPSSLPPSFLWSSPGLCHPDRGLRPHPGLLRSAARRLRRTCLPGASRPRLDGHQRREGEGEGGGGGTKGVASALLTPGSQAGGRRPCFHGSLARGSLPSASSSHGEPVKSTLYSIKWAACNHTFSR